MTNDMLAIHNLSTPDAVIPQAEMEVIRRAAVRPSSGMPDVITLIDQDGSILTRARVIAGDAVSAGLAEHDRDFADSLYSRTGVA